MGAETRAAGPDTPGFLVVDDHRLVGQAVGGLLSEQCGLRRVAICTTVAAAVAVIEASPPDLLLLDLHLPGERWQDCIAALQRCNPEGRVILLTGMADAFVPPPELRGVLLGVVDKARAWDDLITLVQHWQQRLPTASLQRRPHWRELLDRLSPRERRVFEAIGQGMASKEIARVLQLSVSTVETYRKSISAKLDLSGAELVRAATLHRCTTDG